MNPVIMPLCSNHEETGSPKNMDKTYDPHSIEQHWYERWEPSNCTNAGTPGSNDPCTVANYAFDVTPARLVTALVTERGVCAPSRRGLAALYPDLASGA